MSVSDKRGGVVDIYKPGTQEIQANLDFLGRPWLKKTKNKKTVSRVGEIVQLGRGRGGGVLAAKTPEFDLSLVPRTLLLSSDLYTCACTHTQTQNKHIKQTKNKRVKYLFKQVFPFITKKKQKSHPRSWTVPTIHLTGCKSLAIVANLS